MSVYQDEFLKWERNLLRSALILCSGNRTRAAKYLGICRPTLTRKLILHKFTHYEIEEYKKYVRDKFTLDKVMHDNL